MPPYPNAFSCTFSAASFSFSPPEKDLEKQRGKKEVYHPAFFHEGKGYDADINNGGEYDAPAHVGVEDFIYGWVDEFSLPGID